MVRAGHCALDRRRKNGQWHVALGSHFIARGVFFNNATGRQNLQTVGLSITVNGVAVAIFMRLKIVIGDEKSLKEIFGFKGASGFRLCPCCQLVCNHKTKTAKMGNSVRSTCLQIRKFAPHTNDSIRRVVQELYDLSVEVVRNRASIKELELMEYHYGFNDTPMGFLSDAELCSAPRDAVYFDWYHIFVISGIFQKELQIFGVFLVASGLQFAPMATRFLSDWTWPRYVASPKQMFTGFDTNSDHLKCDGHTCTGSYEVLAVFVASVLIPLGFNLLGCESFLKLCDCMDLILSAKYGVVGPELLLETILAFLKAHRAAYGDLAWVPKHHYAIHLAMQLAFLALLLGCNIHEIRHKMAKRWAKDRYTQSNFEGGCIEEITLQHLHDMQNNWLVDGLLNPTVPKAYLLQSMHALFGDHVEVLTARVVHVSNRDFYAGDYAFARTGDDGAQLVHMEFHVSLDSVPHTCVSLFALAPCANDSTWCRRFKKRDASPKMVASKNLITSVTYLERGDCISAIVPALVRMNGLQLC